MYAWVVEAAERGGGHFLIFPAGPSNGTKLLSFAITCSSIVAPSILCHQPAVVRAPGYRA